MTIRSPLVCFCATLVAFALTAAPARAQQYFQAPAGGTGSWDNTSTNWANAIGGPASFTWNNSGTNVANFGNAGGTVTIGGAAFANLFVGGITFSVSGYTITGSSFEFQGTGGPIDTGAFDATINSIINDSGSVGITKSGSGTLTLGATNNYVGPTRINAGTVSISANRNLGANPTTATAASIIFNGGTLLATNSLTLNTNRGITLLGAGTISVASGQTLTYGGIISGTGPLTYSGAGTKSLSGTNTYTGVTNINAGTVIFTSTAALGATGGGSNTIVASGASLTIGNNSINPGETLTLNGTGTADEGALRKIGTTNSNWTAAITLGSASRINSDTSGLLTISGAIGGGANNLTVGGAGNVTVLSVVTTSGTFTKDGAGTLILSANNSAAMTGPVAINGGVVSIPLSTSLGTNAGTITLDGGTLRNTNGGSGGSFVNAARGLVIGANGGTVDYTTGTNTNSSIYAGTITGTGTLTKTGNGEFRYQGTGLPNTTYTKLVVNQGVFRLGFASSTADERGFGAVPGSFLADAITLNGGAIGSSFDVTLDANRGITLGPNGGTIYGVFGTGGAPITIPGAISGSGSLTLSPGTQQITLSGANTNSGTTTITTGTVAIGAANSLSSASAVTIASGGILNLAGFDQTVASLAGDGNVTRTTGALTTGGDNSSTTYTGVIDGSGAVTKAGSGTWTLTGVHTYTGATNINGGTLRLNSGSSLAAGSAVAVNSTATLTGTGTVNGSVTVNTGGTIAPGDAGVGTMTIGNGLTTGNGSTMFLKVTDASTEANDSTGGSTQGTLPNPTSNNFINVTGGSSAIDAGTNFIIDVTGQNFLHNRNYSYQIATVVGDMSGLNITNQAQFVDIGLIAPDATYSITGGAGGQIYLNIHPVPEPATVLGLAAGVLAAGGFIRRRVVRRA